MALPPPPGGQAACPKGHALEEKEVSGTYGLEMLCKKCSGCDKTMKAGTIRHSCKNCKYHLCPSCKAAVEEALAMTDISITLYCAAGPGGQQEDALQVQVERGATIGGLKERISVVYGMAPQVQAIRRDADAEALADTDPLACEEGDVLMLSVVRNPLDIMLAQLGQGLGGDIGGILGGSGARGGGYGQQQQPDQLGDLIQSMLNPLAGLPDALAGAMAQAGEEFRAHQESLETLKFSLTFLMPGNAKKATSDRRCNIEVPGQCIVSEALELVKLELGVEDGGLALEFAGQSLQNGLPFHVAAHMSGLSNGDTVMVVPGGGPSREAPPASGGSNPPGNETGAARRTGPLGGRIERL